MPVVGAVHCIRSSHLTKRLEPFLDDRDSEKSYFADAGYITFQITEVSVLTKLFRIILSANADLQPRPALA